MPSLERRVTALEAAMVDRTAELQELRSRQEVEATRAREAQANTDARINSLADAFMEHRGEVAARFDRVDSDIAELKGDVSVLKGDVSELKGDVSELKGDVSELKAGQAEMRDLLNRIVVKVEG
jgi:chromosome segregation ATPase